MLDRTMLAAREQRIPPRPFRQRHQPRRYFIHRILLYTGAALWAKRLAHARVQQPQKVVALGGSSHRRARIPAGILLPDSHRLRDAVDLIHVRLLHALQELPRIRRKRFHVPPLPLGIDRVESQRRLSRARDARHHGQLVMGNRKRNVLEVVDPRPANPDIVLHRNLPAVSIIRRGAIFKTHEHRFHSSRWREPTAANSTGLPHGILNRIRIPRDHSQEYARWAVRSRAALLPVFQGRGLETKPGRELGLAQPEFAAQCPNVRRGDMDSRYPRGNILSAGPRNSFFETGDDLAA